MPVEEPLVDDFKRKLDYAFNKDRVVRRHRRAIFRKHQRIAELWAEISKESDAIRLRHKALASITAESIKRRLSNYRPSANQIYPRKVFRHTPPP